jgi:hypothetical protein
MLHPLLNHPGFLGKRTPLSLSCRRRYNGAIYARQFYAEYPNDKIREVKYGVFRNITLRDALYVDWLWPSFPLPFVLNTITACPHPLRQNGTFSPPDSSA